MAHRTLLIRLKRETVYWFCYLLKVSAYIAVFLCCHQHEHLRLSITCFSSSSVVLFLSFLSFSYYHFLPYEFHLCCWVGGLRWNKLSLSHTLWVYAHLSYCAALVTSAPYEVCVFVCTYNMSIFGIWLNTCVWNLCVCSCMDTCTNLLLYVQTWYWVCIYICLLSMPWLLWAWMHTSLHACSSRCVCACACMCLHYLVSASVLESPRDYLPPGVTVSW